MKELTAVFLDTLGKKTGQETRAAQLVQNNMRQEIAERTGDLSSSGTLFFSREGLGLKQDLEMLKRKTDNLAEAYQAASVCRQLHELFIRTEELHRATQREIQKKGHIRAQQLHFFYAGEQEEAYEILESFIKTELYRILVLGGSNMFSACKPLRAYPHTLQGRMDYLLKEILPVTDTQKFKKLSVTRYWSVSHFDEMKAGPLGVLPGYRVTDPVKTDHCFLPGEHRLISWRGKVVMQGVGYLTNAAPETIENAQKNGKLKTDLKPEDLLSCTENLEDPDEVLTRVFSGSLYAVSFSRYYSVASYVEACRAVEKRSRVGRCLYCGQEREAGSFCSRCAKRIRIT